MTTKKGMICLIIAMATVLSLTSCGDNKAPAEYHYENFETSCGIMTLWTAYSKGEEEAPFTDEELAAVSKTAADRFEEVYLSLTSGPALTELNGEVDTIFDCDESFLTFIGNVFSLSSDLNGKFTPAHGAYTEAVRSDDKTDESVLSSLAHCGTDKFRISGTTVKKADREAKINLEAYAPGYALDEALTAIKESGAKSGRLSVMDTEIVFGSKPDGSAFTIGVTDGGKTAGYFKITDGCISSFDTSGENSNYSETEGDFEKLTVFATDAANAFTLSRAAFNMTADELSALYDSGAISFEAVAVKRDGTDFMTRRAGMGLYIEETSTETADD